MTIKTRSVETETSPPGGTKHLGKPKLLGLSHAGKQKGPGTGGGHEGSSEHGRSSSPHLSLPQGATTRTSSNQKNAHLTLPTVLQSSRVGM